MSRANLVFIAAVQLDFVAGFLAVGIELNFNAVRPDAVLIAGVVPSFRDGHAGLARRIAVGNVATVDAGAVIRHCILGHGIVNFLIIFVFR